MAYIIRDTNSNYGGEYYFTGVRKMKDFKGRDCEAADFGTVDDAYRFVDKPEAQKRADVLNKIAHCEQFVVEEVSIYNQRYGKRGNNGFKGFRDYPGYEEVTTLAQKDGYNGF